MVQSCRIVRMVLAAFETSLHIARRHQLHSVAEPLLLAAPADVAFPSAPASDQCGGLKLVTSPFALSTELEAACGLAIAYRSLLFKLITDRCLTSVNVYDAQDEAP
jgi:hypothetical protein